MALPLLALAGRTAVVKNAIPIAKKILNPKQMNIDFLRDRGISDFQNFSFDSKGFKKHFNKIKENPKEVLESFKGKIAGTDEISEMATTGVDFDIPVNDDSLETETSEETVIKTPSKFFSNVGNLGNLIQDGRTFGSISLLLMVIIFIVLAIRPVGNSSETRLTLAFKTLLGMTELEGMADEKDLDEIAKNGLKISDTPFSEKLPIGVSPIIKLPVQLMDNAYNFSASDSAKIISKVSPQLQSGVTTMRSLESAVRNLVNFFGGDKE